MSSSIDKIDPVSYLPEEVSRKVLSFLEPKEVLMAHEVSKAWMAIAEDNRLWEQLDLTNAFPDVKVHVFDKAYWQGRKQDLETHGISVDDANFSNGKEYFLAVKRLSQLPLSGEKRIIDFTMPKGLSFNKIVKMEPVKMRNILAPKLFQNIPQFLEKRKFAKK